MIDALSLIDERFHETCRFHALGPHPEEQAEGWRLEGWPLAPPLPPSFETHRSRDAPKDEGRGGCRYDKNLGNAVLAPDFLTPPTSGAVSP